MSSGGRAAPGGRRAARLLVCAAVAARFVGVVAPSTSLPCRKSLDAMLQDENWLFMNNTYTRWCRIRLENEMANCCSVADFAEGRAEGCSECMANCVHTPSNNLCVEHFGKACDVIRKPFYRSGAKGLMVKESFCVPDDCDNAADRAALMPWYSATYKARRGGWHRDFDEALLDCDDGIIGGILAALGIIIGIFAAIPICIFLLKAPKERGRTLVSQSDMQDSAADAPALEDLRSTAGTMD